jgi:hypothetical protein
MENNTKCVKLVVLIMAMDSESRNRGAEEIFSREREVKITDPEFAIVSMLPDGVHVGKRMNCHFSNWFLLFLGNRINRVLIRAVRNDQYLKCHLQPFLSVASCRLRDRMDVESMLEISSQEVIKIISDKAPRIMQT